MVAEPTTYLGKEWSSVRLTELFYFSMLIGISKATRKHRFVTNMASGILGSAKKIYMIAL